MIQRIVLILVVVVLFDTTCHRRCKCWPYVLILVVVVLFDTRGEDYSLSCRWVLILVVVVLFKWEVQSVLFGALAEPHCRNVHWTLKWFKLKRSQECSVRRSRWASLSKCPLDISSYLLLWYEVRSNNFQFSIFNFQFSNVLVFLVFFYTFVAPARLLMRRVLILVLEG